MVIFPSKCKISGTYKSPNKFANTFWKEDRQDTMISLSADRYIFLTGLVGIAGLFLTALYASYKGKKAISQYIDKW